MAEKINNLREGSLVTVEAIRDFYGVIKGETKKVAYNSITRKMIDLKFWKILNRK